MNLQIPQKDLIKPLTLVRQVSGDTKSSNLPILKNIHLSAQSDQLTITGSDLEVEIRVSIPLVIPSQIVTTLNANKLNDLIKSQDESTQVRFGFTDSQAIIKCNRGRYKLNTLEPDAFPLMDFSDQDTYSVTLEQDKFLNILNRVSHSIAKQDVRYYLNGVYFEFDDNKLTIVSTDGHRLSRFVYPDTIECDDLPNIILPRKTVETLKSQLTKSSDNISLIFNKNKIRISYDNIMLTSNLIDGSYPDYKSVIPVDSTKIITVNKNDLKSILSRIIIFSDKKTKSVEFEVSNNTLSLSTVSDANSDSTESINDVLDCDYSNEVIRTSFNSQYILDALQSIPSNEVSIVFPNVAEKSTLLYASDENPETSLCIVMPTRTHR